MVSRACPSKTIEIDSALIPSRLFILFIDTVLNINQRKKESENKSKRRWGKIVKLVHQYSTKLPVDNVCMWIIQIVGSRSYQ